MAYDSTGFFSPAPPLYKTPLLISACLNLQNSQNLSLPLNEVEPCMPMT